MKQEKKEKQTKSVLLSRLYYVFFCNKRVFQSLNAKKKKKYVHFI